MDAQLNVKFVPGTTENKLHLFITAFVNLCYKPLFVPYDKLKTQVFISCRHT